MKSAPRVIALLLSLSILLFCASFFAKQSQAYYSCGNGPCKPSYPCNGGLTCNPDPGGVCGIFYNTCTGAHCNNNGGWDASSCNTGDACNPGGSDATANWSGCSAACGSGVLTCQAGVVNGCPVACTGPAGAIGSTTPCCINQAPVAPSAVTCTQIGIGRTAQVNWTFPNGTGCGQPFGYNCSGNDDIFDLRFNGGKAFETEAPGTTPYSHTTGLFPAWGTYTLQVCALNGGGESCSPVTNCVLTPPTCTTTGMDVTNANPDNTCIGTNPTLSASSGNNANLIEFLIDPNNPLTAPYLNQSGWMGSIPGPISYTPTLGTGQYYWTVHTQSGAAPVDCVTPAVEPTGMVINIDKTAPPAPNGSFTSRTPDPACLSNYFMTYTWNSVADADCAGLNALPYQAQIALNSGYAPVASDSSWISTRTLTTDTSFPAGSTVYGRVRARDSLGNTSGWTATEGVGFSIPIPSPYPTLKIVGTYNEDVGYSSPICTGGMSLVPANLTLTLDIQPSDGVSYTCDTVSDPTGYSCNITFDNVGTTCVPQDHTISLTGSSYGGYTAVEWRENNTCTNPVLPNITVDASRNNVTPTPMQTYFKYGAKSWFKTSNISFNNRVQRDNIIPNNTTQFDSDDDINPSNNKHLIVGSGNGTLLEGIGKAINLGGNADQGYSAHNWFNVGYTTSTIFTPSKFTDYMKSRKQYKTVTSTGQITADGIYYVSGDITLDSGSAFDNKKVVLVADQGKVTISPAVGTTFIPSNGSLAIIANTIEVSGSVTEVDAILVGNTVTVGPADNATYLKINGNLIQLKDVPGFINTRISNDVRKPAMFVKLNQATYLNLLPYLSISVYDWRQVQ